MMKRQELVKNKVQTFERRKVPKMLAPGNNTSGWRDEANINLSRYR
jgi:hypothetical protein